MQALNKDQDDAVEASDSKNIDTMLDFNALHYEIPPDLSVCTNKTIVNNYFQNQSYGGTGQQNAVGYCILNTGAHFVDGRDSYLVFDVTTTTSVTTNRAVIFGKNGSAFNFFKRFSITDRSGNEIERIMYPNKLINMLLRGQYDANFLRTYGNMFLTVLPTTENQTINPQAWANQTTANLNGRRFILPLRLISGLFDYNQLLPPQLMSGLRFEIELESPETALELIGSTAVDPAETANFTITNPRIVTTVHQLSDSVVRTINERSANNGLEIYFRTWYCTATSIPSGSTQYNLESRKAVSRCFGSLLSFYPETATLAKDMMQTATQQLRTWQYRAGNLYFPLQPVNGSTITQTNSETLWHMQRYFGKNKQFDCPNSISLQQFNTIPDINTVSIGNLVTYPCDLERSDVMDLSGIPLNNSRILAFLAEGTATTETLQALHWISYLKLVRVFMENVEIEE
jgi:hypothetical protein